MIPGGKMTPTRVTTSGRGWGGRRAPRLADSLRRQGGPLQRLELRGVARLERPQAALQRVKRPRRRVPPRAVRHSAGRVVPIGH